MRMWRQLKLSRIIACLIMITSGLLFLKFIRFVTPNIRRYKNSSGLPHHNIELKTESLDFDLDFVPKDLKVCEDFFTSFSSSSSGSKSYNMSANYYNRLKEFYEAIDEIQLATGNKEMEGHSGDMKQQTMVLHYLAGHPFVRTVCETGFNMGHSSFNYLTANPHLSVYSFDFGGHEYSHAMALYLKALFPGRFSIRYGNSMETIPKFIEENPEVKCDVLLVDGGHTYEVAHADFLNFARMAHLERNIVMFDDYPTDWAGGFGEAWMQEVNNGFINELMRCTFDYKKGGLERGFVLGKFMSKLMNKP